MSHEKLHEILYELLRIRSQQKRQESKQDPGRYTLVFLERYAALHKPPNINDWLLKYVPAILRDCEILYNMDRRLFHPVQF